MIVPPPGSVGYDSRPDTMAHALRVAELIVDVATEILRRGPVHDRSKLAPPEVDAFDRITPRLAASTYGTREYHDALDEIRPALEHHYETNRHHPEYHEDGVAGMTLVDVVEMLADWKAATERHDDGDLGRSLDVQTGRFGLDPQVAAILRNTAAALQWL